MHYIVDLSLYSAAAVGSHVYVKRVEKERPCRHPILRRRTSPVTGRKLQIAPNGFINIPSSPGGEEAKRKRVVAKFHMQLRAEWCGAGIIKYYYF